MLKSNKQLSMADSVRRIRAELKKSIQKYNTYRPHKNLKELTPMEHIKTVYQKSMLCIIMSELLRLQLILTHIYTSLINSLIYKYSLL